jgi:hypothetical protein
VSKDRKGNIPCTNSDVLRKIYACEGTRIKHREKGRKGQKERSRHTERDRHREGNENTEKEKGSKGRKIWKIKKERAKMGEKDRQKENGIEKERKKERKRNECENSFNTNQYPTGLTSVTAVKDTKIKLSLCLIN